MENWPFMENSNLTEEGTKTDAPIEWKKKVNSYFVLI